MENKNLFSFDMKWNYRATMLFLFLLFVPNLLGMLNIQTPFGVKVHFFQLAVFLAAFVYGPIGGLLSGIAGSAYSAILSGNPYIIIGNAMLGFFAGLFARKGMNPVVAVILAFAIQLPWLLATDYYLMHLPAAFLKVLVPALLVSNIVWALVAGYASRHLKASVQ